METHLSDKSDVEYREVAAVLGAIATKKAEISIIVGFGSTAKEVILNPDDTMMTNIERIKKLDVGHSTEAHLAFDVLGNRKVDRIFLFSDMQCYNRTTYYYGTVDSRWKDYQKQYPNAYLYSFDLSAYGTAQTPSNRQNVVLLNGWSDKVLDFVNLNEKRGVMESQIKKW